MFVLTFHFNYIQRLILIITIHRSAFRQSVFENPYWQIYLTFSGNYFTTGFIGESHHYYPCDTCNRTYRRLITLQRHKKLECGKEATFGCVLCNSRFKHKHSLQRHLKVHIPASSTTTPPTIVENATDPPGTDEMWRMHNFTWHKKQERAS